MLTVGGVDPVPINLDDVFLSLLSSAILQNSVPCGTIPSFENKPSSDRYLFTFHAVMPSVFQYFVLLSCVFLINHASLGASF